MQVHIVGSGDAFGNGDRLQTCFSISTGEHHVLVDCGASSLTGMKSQGIDPLTVDVVVISHLHGDHFGGLPFLVLDAQFQRRTRPLVIYGPPGLRQRLTTAMETLYPGSSSTKQRFTLDTVELDPDGSPQSRDGVTVRGLEVDHFCGAPPLAVRVQAGDEAIAYSGDTAWTPALIDACRETQLFLVEAYTWERQVKWHLAYRSIADHHDEFDTAAVMLTHMSPDMLNRAHLSGFPLASDGLRFTV